MLYFSELKYRKILTEDGAYVGRLSDFLFLPREKALLTRLVTKDLKGKKITIDFTDVKRLGKELIVKKGYTLSARSTDELSVREHLLDKQILDIAGNKVVRVNDVVIHESKHPTIAGVDIGLLGILRWFGLDEALLKLTQNLSLRVDTSFLPWSEVQPLELASGRLMLKSDIDRLEKMLPEDLADHLEQTNLANTVQILSGLEKDYAAEVVGSLNISFQTALFKQLYPKDAADIVALMDPDEAVDVLLTLPTDSQEAILADLDEETREDILYLKSLSQTPIGELITSEFLEVKPDDTQKGIIDKIKKETEDFSHLKYVYVVNKQDALVGAFSLHELLMQPPDTLAYKFMIPNLAVIHLSTPKEIALKKLRKYKLDAMPVVNSERKIIGIVVGQDLVEEEE